MKVILLLVPLAISLGGTSHAVEKKELISESTYSLIETSCNSCCISATPSKDDKYISYCSCGCTKLVDNVRFVVDSNSLKYEKDLYPYLRSVMPTQDQISECKEQNELQ